MKTTTLIAGLILAAAAGWFASRHWPEGGGPESAGAQDAGGRRILYYQSPMHPWIKSDKPGRCTICGMKLTPVFEGDPGLDTGEGVTALGSNTIQVLHVRSEPAARRPLERTLRVAGTIEEDDTRHRVLAAYVDGRIDRLFVNHLGAEVAEGQPLATFYSQALLGAERDYTSLLNQSGLETFGDLKAQRERMLAAARLRLVQYGLTGAQIDALAGKPATNIHTEILAPMTGTVVRRLSYEGQYVKQGDPLFEIADFSVMWFQFDAYERDLTWIEPGQTVEVTAPAAAGKAYSGKITFIDPNLKNETRSAKVRVEIPNPPVESGGVQRRELYHRLYLGEAHRIFVEHLERLEAEHRDDALREARTDSGDETGPEISFEPDERVGRDGNQRLHAKLFPVPRIFHEVPSEPHACSRSHGGEIAHHGDRPATGNLADLDDAKARLFVLEGDALDFTRHGRRHARSLLNRQCRARGFASRLERHRCRRLDEVTMAHGLVHGYPGVMNRAFSASLASIFLAACSGSEAAGPGAPVSDGGASHDASSTEIRMEQAKVGDFVFDVRVAGPKSGKPVILLHGFPETSYEWRSQLAALARAGYRAIAPNQRGYSPGARPKAVSDYAVTLLAQDVVGIADAMGVDQFHLVGHDWGAAVAWVVAKLAAARVLTVTPISVPHPDAFKTVLSDQTSCQYAASSYFDLFTTPEATNSMISADAGFLRTVLTGLDPADVDVYVDALGNFDTMDAALNWYRANVANRQIVGPELGQITVPTMFIWSDGDVALCREGGDLTVNYVDAPYRFEIIPGVSHWVPELAADRVNELLLSQLSGRDR